MVPPYSITQNSITVYIDDDQRVFNRDSNFGKELFNLITQSNPDEQKIRNFIYSFKNEIEDLGIEGIEVGDNDCVEFRGESVPRGLGLMMKEFHNNQNALQPLLNFWNKLKKNPDQRPIYHLFEAAQKFKFPITLDGNVVCWKRVKGDINNPSSFRDIHTGKFLNSPGTIVAMKREDVDSDPNVACSRGLHVANWNYSFSFYGNGVMLEVLVDPKDVVAIPYDHNQEKIRVCRYKVIKVVDDRRPDYEIVEDDEYVFDDDENHITDEIEV